MSEPEPTGSGHFNSIILAQAAGKVKGHKGVAAIPLLGSSLLGVPKGRGRKPRAIKIANPTEVGFAIWERQLAAVFSFQK